jgi:hypothetical protein
MLVIGSSFTSSAFRSRLEIHLSTLVLSAANDVVAVFSYYNQNPNPTQDYDDPAVTEGNTCLKMRDSRESYVTVPVSGPPETVAFIGSGMIVGPISERYFIITARHNVLSTRKSSINQKVNDLILARVEFAFADSMNQLFAAERHNKPNIAPKDRAPHWVQVDPSPVAWYHNSDFAILLVTSKDFKCDPLPPPRDIKYYSPIVGEQVYVFGVPAALSETAFAEKYPGKSYQDFVDTFVVYTPNVSIGSVLAFNDTLCTYNANTADGMSGGPVFVVRDSELIPIGLHVGWLDDKQQNYFVPFVMPQLMAELKHLFVYGSQ